jgi:hypothetical protein
VKAPLSYTHILKTQPNVLITTTHNTQSTTTKLHWIQYQLLVFRFCSFAAATVGAGAGGATLALGVVLSHHGDLGNLGVAANSTS